MGFQKLLVRHSKRLQRLNLTAKESISLGLNSGITKDDQLIPCGLR